MRSIDEVTVYHKDKTMPLIPGKKNVGKNIKTEMAGGKPQKQAVAIALNVARPHKSKVKSAAQKMFGGRYK